MSETAAVAIATIQAGRVTDDGAALLLKARQPDGGELILAVAAAQLPALVDLAALGHSECRRLAGVDPDRREAYTATWWEFARDQASSSIILSLTFGSGGRLDFLLSGQMPAQMLETLEVLTGRATPIGHDIRPN